MPTPSQSGTNVFSANAYLENLEELGLETFQEQIATSVCARALDGRRLTAPLSDIQILGWPIDQDGPKKANVAYVWSERQEVLFLIAAFGPNEAIEDLSPAETAEAHLELMKLVLWVVRILSGMLGQ